MTIASSLRSHLRTTWETLDDLQRIARLPLGPEWRRALCWTQLNTFIFGRLDRKQHRAEVAGFQVHYLEEATLRLLFREIFLGMEYLFPTQNPAPLIVDCGSNIGLALLFFKRLYPGARILAFEPNSGAFECLRQNVQSNHLQDIELVPKAVCDHDGEIDFYYDAMHPGSLTMSTIAGRSQDHCTVSATKLSHYINAVVDFLKLDVEGAELSVLQELRSENKLRFVQQMAVEYHHHLVPSQDTFSELLQMLEDEGFGYEIEADLQRPFRAGRFQDILVYAYQRDQVIPR